MISTAIAAIAIALSVVRDVASMLGGVVVSCILHPLPHPERPFRGCFFRIFKQVSDRPRACQIAAMILTRRGLLGRFAGHRSRPRAAALTKGDRASLKRGECET